jgi:hypothetical protein
MTAINSRYAMFDCPNSLSLLSNIMPEDQAQYSHIYIHAVSL